MFNLGCVHGHIKQKKKIGIYKGASPSSPLFPTAWILCVNGRVGQAQLYWRRISQSEIPPIPFLFARPSLKVFQNSASGAVTYVTHPRRVGES